MRARRRHGETLPRDAARGVRPYGRLSLMKKMLIVLFAALPVFGAQKKVPFSVVEATIPEMQRAMVEGRVTSRELVTQSLIRIAMYEDRLNAVMAVNANALKEADERDRERAAGKVRGPLHGIPWGAKDLFATKGIPTTWGAEPYRQQVIDYDAAVVERLRAAGAGVADPSRRRRFPPTGR